MNWEHLEECDVLSLWGKDNLKKLESLKWQERRESLEALVQLLEKNQRLSSASMADYGEIVGLLKKILMKDSNINVVISALKVIGGLARGLRTNFSPFAGVVLPYILERSKDKKPNVRDAVGEALYCVCCTCDPSRLVKDITEFLEKPSPQTKQCVCLFLSRFFISQLSSPPDFLKSVIPLIVKLLDDPDPNVRTSALQSMGAMKALFGEPSSIFLRAIADKSKLEKIEIACKQAKEERDKILAECVLQSNNDDFPLEEGCSDGSASTNVKAGTSDIDPWDFKDALDISNKIASNFHYMLGSSKWQDRKEALDSFCMLLKDEPKLLQKPELDELILNLLKVLEKDVNVNVACTAAVALRYISLGLRSHYSCFVTKTLAICFDRLKDKKPVLRSSLISLADQVGLCDCIANYATAIEGGITSKNPQSRAQTCLFLSRLLANHSKSTLSRSVITSVVPLLTKASSDGDGEVRESSFKAVAAIARMMGEDTCKQLFAGVVEDKARSEKIWSYVAAVDDDMVPARRQAIIRVYSEIEPCMEDRNATKKVVHLRPISASTGNYKQQPKLSTSRPRPATAFSTRKMPVKMSAISTVRPATVQRQPATTTRVVVSSNQQSTTFGKICESRTTRPVEKPLPRRNYTAPFTVRNSLSTTTAGSKNSVRNSWNTVGNTNSSKLSNSSIAPSSASEIRPPSVSGIRPPTNSRLRPPSSRPGLLPHT